MTKPTWTMYHPNGKGTGSALRLELYPAHDQTSGSIYATLAPQKTVGARTAEEVTYPTFDWEKTITIKLDIMDLAQILQVLRGCTESLADGKGLFHRSLTANAVIKFEHRIEPVPCYLLEVSRKPVVGDVERIWFMLRTTEAFALSEAISHALVYLAFGIPMVNE